MTKCSINEECKRAYNQLWREDKEKANIIACSIVLAIINVVHTKHTFNIMNDPKTYYLEYYPCTNQVEMGIEKRALKTHFGEIELNGGK